MGAVGCLQPSELWCCSAGKTAPMFWNECAACILKASWSVLEQLKVTGTWPLEPLGVAQLRSVTSQTTGVYITVLWTPWKVGGCLTSLVRFWLALWALRDELRLTVQSTVVLPHESRMVETMTGTAVDILTWLTAQKFQIAFAHHECFKFWIFGRHCKNTSQPEFSPAQ